MSIRNLFNRLAVGVLAINLVICALAGLALQRSRRNARRQAALSTQNLARTLAVNVSGVIDKIDVGLFAAAGEAERQLAGGGIDGPRLTGYLAAQQGRIRDFEGMWVADQQGIVRWGSDIAPGTTVDISDREYFHRLREAREPELVISRPVMGRVTKAWSILIARRIRRTDGSFGGTAFGSLRVRDYFAAMFSAVDVGREGHIELRDDRLALVARYPGMAGEDGQSLPGLLPAGVVERIRADPGSGSGTVRDGQDKAEWTFSFQKVPDRPFSIFVARSGSDYLPPWRNEVVITLVILGLFTSCTIAFARAYARKKLEQETTQQKTLLEALFNGIPDAVAYTDTNRKIVSVNRSFTSMFGYGLDEVRGEEASLFYDSMEDFQEQGKLRFHTLQSEPMLPAEMTFRNKAGSTFPGELTSSMLRRAGGEPLGYISVIRDITERRRVEAEVQRLTEGLEQRVQARTAQLEAANQEMEAFSYSVSHDLRAPLRSIDGFSRALLEDCGDQLDADGRQYLQRVRAGTQRMGLLIDDLLKLSKSSRGELKVADGSLSELFARTAHDLALNDPERRVEVIVRPGMRLRADLRLMQVVVENLLGNAWKFTAKAGHPRIEAGECLTPDGRRAFFLRDNGAGFDMAHADKLFSAFQRLHSASDFEGTGIGLALVQRIIHRHGGQVWAEAEPGNGAAFYFSLPDPG